MLFSKTIMASAMLATTEALSINRAHIRAHREARSLEVREPKDPNVVVKVTTKTIHFNKNVKPVTVTVDEGTKTVHVQANAQATQPPVVEQAPKKEEPAPAIVVAAPAPSQKAPEPSQAPAKEESKPAATSNSNTAPAVSGGKRGIVYAGDRTEFLSGLVGTKCSWSYDWGSKKGKNAPDSLEFVPMCWSQAKCPDFASDVASSGAKAVLSFNEPDVPQQANRSPAQAAAEHKAVFGGLVGKYQIGAPSVTSTLGNPAMGLAWLKDFFAACGSDCPVNFCPVHFYGNPGDEQYLYNHLKDAHDVCGGKDIWLTEFGLNSGDRAAHATFMGNVIPKLESSEFSYVKRYAYFMGSTDPISPLVDIAGVTDVGLKYATGF